MPVVPDRSTVVGFRLGLVVRTCWTERPGRRRASVPHPRSIWLLHYVTGRSVVHSRTAISQLFQEITLADRHPES